MNEPAMSSDALFIHILDGLPMDICLCCEGWRQVSGINLGPRAERQQSPFWSTIFSMMSWPYTSFLLMVACISTSFEFSKHVWNSQDLATATRLAASWGKFIMSRDLSGSTLQVLSSPSNKRNCWRVGGRKVIVQRRKLCCWKDNICSVGRRLYFIVLPTQPTPW